MIPDLIINAPVNDDAMLKDADIQLDSELKCAIFEFRLKTEDVIKLANKALTKFGPPEKLYYLKLIEDCLVKMDECTLTGRWS